MIETIFEKDGIYPSAIEASLCRIFPDPFFFQNPQGNLQEQFDFKLPIFRWFWKDGHLSLHLVCRHRLNVGKFFYEMIHRWLLPGRRLDVAFFFSSDFKYPDVGPHLYTIAEMAIRFDKEVDRDHIEHNLRVIETEIRLGMVSVYHASRLLEMHLLSAQEKNGILQEKISKLIQRNPEEIDYDIFGELQHFVVMSKEEFKTPRDPRHLSRLVTLFYLFRKSIERDQEKKPGKRHIRLKLASVQLDLPWGQKKVLGVCVALNFLRLNELFEERHLIRALQNGLPGIKAVADSFFVNEGDQGIHTLYLEIEKENGEDFTFSELQHLRKFLPEEVKRTVEVPHSSIFMPRNEEEIIRHVVSLSGQLRFVKDLPQVILIFDEQKEGDLYFTVLLVRILYPNSSSIQTLFSKEDSVMTYIPDRVKRVGMLRKRYPKEATVFRLRFSSKPFLRDDHSVDLFRARQAIIQEMQRLIGDVRDYNGGMIAKQIELLGALQQLLGNDRASRRLLESFFHAIYPIEARSIVPPEQLKKLFLLWKQLLEDPSQKIMTQQDEHAIYVMAKSGHLPEIDPANFVEMQLISARPEQEEKFLGYLFFSQDLAERERFLENVPSPEALLEHNP